MAGRQLRGRLRVRLPLTAAQDSRMEAMPGCEPTWLKLGTAHVYLVIVWPAMSPEEGRPEARRAAETAYRDQAEGRR